MKHPYDIDFSRLDEIRNRAVAVRARDDREAADYQHKPAAIPPPAPPLRCIVRARTPAPIRHDRGYEDITDRT